MLLKEIDASIFSQVFLYRLIEVAQSTKNRLVEFGYSAYTVEDFMETVSI